MTRFDVNSVCFQVTFHTKEMQLGSAKASFSNGFYQFVSSVQLTPLKGWGPVAPLLHLWAAFPALRTQLSAKSEEQSYEMNTS